jgi:N-acyl-D-aspartate/D-glutamate deacylase
MVKMLEEGLEAGAWGFSNGLEYTTERATTEEEMIELCKIVAQSGGLFSTHERNKDLFAVEAIEEGIRVAKASGVRLQISHIIPRRGSPVGSVQKVMDIVQDSHDAGIDIGFDAHTRLHGIMNVSAALPTWAFKGGPMELEKRLRDKSTRELLKQHESIVSGKNTVGWDRVFLYTSYGYPDMAGKSFSELTSDGRDVFDVIFDIILSEKDDPHRSLIISHSYEEEWLRQTFIHPLCAPASDATALCKDGPLSETVFLGAYTWASWFFNKLVNEFAEYTTEQAVNKLTTVPAKQAGISNRGRIEVDYAADITVFNPETFKENGTLYDPNHFAAGVDHVIVNGGLAMESGLFTNQRFGQVLRRR